MAYNFLNQALAQICGAINTPPQYIFPTVKNLPSGNYTSEIIDVKDIVDPNGDLSAIDFYHRLTDSNGNVIHSRFRYYSKELPRLAASLQQYPQAQTWLDTVGLKENITVAPKSTGNYMHIAARTACLANVNATVPVALPVSTTSPAVSPASAPPEKRGGLSSRLSSSKHSNKPVQTPRQALISEDDDDEFDDFLDESDE